MIILVVVADLAGVVGSVFTFPAIGAWYASLVKPWFTPPSWVFGPVWTILYALMG
ncbi:MAG: tryptophan-rich sensory protein, partial [Candidatus Aenigmarchaeota archaeon]|nr:tryptophan-rich sensory protein [Candidatus Aenigmarchaeota archaeon]